VHSRRCRGVLKTLPDNVYNYHSIIKQTKLNPVFSWNRSIL